MLRRWPSTTPWSQGSPKTNSPIHETFPPRIPAILAMQRWPERNQKVLGKPLCTRHPEVTNGPGGPHFSLKATWPIYPVVTRWFQPIWKILVKLGIFPNFRGENKKYLKPPPSHGMSQVFERYSKCWSKSKGRLLMPFPFEWWKNKPWKISAKQIGSFPCRVCPLSLETTLKQWRSPGHHQGNCYLSIFRGGWFSHVTFGAYGGPRPESQSEETKNLNKTTTWYCTKLLHITFNSLITYTELGVIQIGSKCFICGYVWNMYLGLSR